MIAREDSWAAKGSSFLPNTLWVCEEVEGANSGNERMWPSGKYAPMTREETDSIRQWVEGKENAADEELLVCGCGRDMCGANTNLDGTVGGYIKTRKGKQGGE
jgi:Cu2+-containing amine oxidase